VWKYYPHYRQHGKLVCWKGVGESFQLNVGHLPKLSHLSLFHGCDFGIVEGNIDPKWSSPMIRSLQFGETLYSQHLKMIISSSSLLQTLHIHYVDATDLEMIVRDCPNLQHLSICEMDNADEDIGTAIGKMTQLKSLVLDAGIIVPTWMDSLACRSSWLDLESLIHLQGLTIKGCSLMALESFLYLFELVQYLSSSQSCDSNHGVSGTHNKGRNDATKVSIVSNGSLLQINDMSCHEWLSNNHC
jgi:hypothetical protein